jgi:hypothetical protein
MCELNAQKKLIDGFLAERQLTKMVILMVVLSSHN